MRRDNSIPTTTVRWMERDHGLVYGRRKSDVALSDFCRYAANMKFVACFGRISAVLADSIATTMIEDTNTSTAEDTPTVTDTIATNTSVPSDSADQDSYVSEGGSAGESGSPDSETEDSGSGTKCWGDRWRC
ncbi:hypothetical protein BDV19DRAFT_206823 [Aspergillus venezuelensis]